MLSFELTDDHRLLERSVREWAAREVAPRIHDLDRAHHCKGAVIYEGTREIHKVMQADDVLGYRSDRPARCELPARKGEAS